MQFTPLPQGLGPEAAAGEWGLDPAAHRGLLIRVLCGPPSLLLFLSSRPMTCPQGEPIGCGSPAFPCPLCLHCPLSCPLSCPLHLSPLTSPPAPSWSLFCLLAQVQERPKALQAEVALTLEVLGNMIGSGLPTILGQPLHTLRYIHSQLQICVSPGSLGPWVLPMVPPVTRLPLSPSSSLTVPILCPQTQPQPTAEPRPPSRRLSRWLHRLQEAEKVSLSGQGTEVCSAWEL